ncbi:MAG: DUF4872 domain-containing protein, partial [Anaerolineaceae bacterium]|nr:DUF4872 domain-containing protein [Anaerolineaceae bacterium]
LAADREGVLYPLALADLARARASQYPPFAPHHKWYTFDFSGFRSPASHEVWAAIGETAQAMLHPPIANLGVRGIHTARQRTLRWPREMDAGALKAACFNVYIMIDATGGTGGGLFRYMYARFLDEAAALTGEARLAAVGRSFARAGDRWQDVALGFREAAQAPDPAQCIEAAGRPLEEIAALEEAAWAELGGLVRERQSS